MIRRIITLIPLAGLLLGCSLALNDSPQLAAAESVAAEPAAAEPINFPSPTVTTVALMQTADANQLSTRVAVSGLEGTAIAVEATTQSMNQQATLNAVAAVYAADAATATTMAFYPTATAEAIATQAQAQAYAQATAAAAQVQATEAALASMAAAATTAAGELAIQETSVAVRSTAAAISSQATREWQQAALVAEEEQVRRQQQQIALERSRLLNGLLRGIAVTVPLLLGLYIALAFYRERRRLALPVLPAMEAAGAVPTMVDEPTVARVTDVTRQQRSPIGATAHQQLAAPEWASLGHWRGSGLPLGVSDFGLMSASMESQAHLLFLGSSSSNMTRAGLRPVIAAALGNGWHVSIFDRSGWEYLPFDGHDNAAIFILGSAHEAVAYLAAVDQEVQSRLGQVKSKRPPHPRASSPARSLIVVDQFSQLANLLDKAQRAELWRYARAIAADGHKVGIHIALALQDPTPDSFDLRIRRHCLPLAFRLKDEAASQLVLGSRGAESLPERHFLAPMPELIHGIGFAPSDIELQRYLAETRSERVDGPIWTRAARMDVLSQSKRATVMSFGALPVGESGSLHS